VGGFSTPLSGAHVRIHPVIFTGDDVLVVAVVPLVLGGLGWFLLRTDAGVAVRAVPDNSERALLLGIPVRRLSTLVWVIAGVLAALTVMVNGPSQGVTLSAAAGPTLLLPALAAAVVARMESLPIAFGAGVGLGVIDSITRFNITKQAASDVAFLVVILAALLIQRGRSNRAEDTEGSWVATGIMRPIPEALRRLPEVVAGRVLLGVTLAGVLLLVPFAFGPGTVNEFTTAVIYGIVVISLVVLSGWAGNISLGQFAFAGIGGVVTGDLISHWNVDFFLCLAAAGASGALLAVMVGLPALRIRGLLLPVTTLAFAVALDSFFLNPTNFESLIPSSFVRPFLWKRFDLQNVNDYYYFCLAILVLVIVCVVSLRAARAGRVLLATRDNQRAASAMAVPTTRVKVVAFVLAGAIAGLAGGLHASALGSVGFHTYDPSISLLLFSMAVIGGLGSISGALLGVATIEVAVHAVPQYQLIITGAGLLWLLLILPGGLGEALQRVRNRVLRRIAASHNLVVPTLVADRLDDASSQSAPREDALLAGALSSEEAALRASVETEELTSADDAHPPIESARGETDDRPTPLLRCRQVEVSYGSVQILFGADLEVAEGEIVALLGTNGAGKSTLLKGAAGLVKVGSGSVELDGRAITNTPADAAARLGMALMPGGRGVFPTLTVDENLRLAAWLLRKDRTAAAEARQDALAVFPMLSDRIGQMAGNLSGGEQQMLSLAMAFMVKPRLLMIDELSLGLAPTVVSQLLDVVRELHARGTTIVVVEQSVNLALELAQRAVFLEKGEVRFTGPAADLLDRPDILRSVFIAGGKPTITSSARSQPRADDDGARLAPDEEAAVVLECRGVTKHFGGIQAVAGIDLSLREDEILGLIGHNGAGKTTLFDLISGFLAHDRGRILLGGMDIGFWPSHLRAVAGLGRSFQEARLFPSLTVTETIAVALERHLASRDLVAAALQLPASTDSEAQAAIRVEELVATMGLGSFREKLVGELSTGTRRIVELACILAQDPAVVLLDEPSGGVAQRETEALGPLLLRVQRRSGCSILVIEHDMPLITSICDRVIALELGGVIASGTPTEVMEHPQVVASYLGTDQSSIRRSGGRSRPLRARATRSAQAAVAENGPEGSLESAAAPMGQGGDSERLRQ
jgi:ABC-type branched-subunit amino acid transport system ATPase component/ABC-type branched-subunit amino acid transport system permease subunit